VWVVAEREVDLLHDERGGEGWQQQ
jgi:hypothetical protein